MKNGKPAINVIFNPDEKIGYGVGYYIIYYSKTDKCPYMDMFFSTKVTPEVDFVSVGILNRIKYLLRLGYEFDVYFTPTIEQLF